MTDMAKSTGPRVRLWWLLVLLLLLVNVVAWQRKPIAGWLGQLAFHRAGSDPSRAQQYITIAQWLSKQSPQVALARARLRRHQTDLDEFRRELQRARYLGIDSELAEREQWLALAQSGNMSVAGPQLVNLLETGGGEEAEISEAFAVGYMRMRDYASALALLGAWANELPNDARPHAWIGQIKSELRASEEAEKAFREALRLDPENAAAALGLGQLLLDLKRSDEAIDFFRIAVSDDEVGASASAGLASALQAQSRPQEAAEVLEVGLNRFPDDYRLLAQKADGLVEQGEYAAAEQLLKSEIESGSRRRELRYTYAVALRGIGRVDEAAEHFAYANEAAERIAAANLRIADVTSDPTNAELRYEIGYAHLTYGNIEDGLMWLRGALEIDPKHHASHRALAEYYSTKTRQHPRYIGLAQRHRIAAGKLPD
jgi:tetratricopeptide (TPR) repeat protein